MMTMALALSLSSCSGGPKLDVSFMVSDSTICAVLTPQVPIDQVDVRLEAGHIVICYDNPNP